MKKSKFNVGDWVSFPGYFGSSDRCYRKERNMGVFVGWCQKSNFAYWEKIDKNGKWNHLKYRDEEFLRAIVYMKDGHKIIVQENMMSKLLVEPKVKWNKFDKNDKSTFPLESGSYWVAAGFYLYDDNHRYLNREIGVSYYKRKEDCEIGCDDSGFDDYDDSLVEYWAFIINPLLPEEWSKENLKKWREKNAKK